MTRHEKVFHTGSERKRKINGSYIAIRLAGDTYNVTVIDKGAILDLIAKKNIVTGMIDLGTQVTPNGVELSLHRIYQFKESGIIDFSNQERHLPSNEEIEPINNRYNLAAGSYLVTYNETVNIPTDMIAIGRPRSSLLRSGVTIESAIWDAGYSGRSRGLLTVFNPQGFVVTQNARLLHLIFIRLEQMTKPYEGVYQGET